MFSSATMTFGDGDGDGGGNEWKESCLLYTHGCLRIDNENIYKLASTAANGPNGTLAKTA